MTTLMREYSVKGGGRRTSPGYKDARNKDQYKACDQLSDQDQTRFRRAAATLNFLALDRPDIAQATKELCRKMGGQDAGTSWA